MKSNAAVCLQELEEAISYFLLPALTGQPSPNAAVRAVLALPARQGGLGIVNPIELFDRQRQASSTICGPIVKLIMQQGGDIIAARHEQHAIKKEFSKRL